MKDIEIYSANHFSSNSEVEFSTSKYFFGLAYLEGHQKNRKEKSFPRINPQKEDYSRLVRRLKELGLKF